MHTFTQTAKTCSTLSQCVYPSSMEMMSATLSLPGPTKHTGRQNTTSERSTLSYASQPNCFLALKSK